MCSSCDRGDLDRVLGAISSLKGVMILEVFSNVNDSRI